VDRLSELLGHAVQFVYTCWDRIVLSGYIERLQRPENLIYFFQDVVGINAIEPAVLEQRTKAYKGWVRRITEEQDIPVVAAPHGVKKEDLVEPYYRRLKGDQGVACVLTSLEQGRTFVSYVPRWKVPSGDANYRFIKACRKQFLHYYWYVLDPVMGPMSVRVASYFPFNVTCYLNGHSFVAQELRRDGVRFRKADNAFLAVSDVAALQMAADQLSAALLERRCTYWVRRVVPVFSPDERAALRPGLPLQHGPDGAGNRRRLQTLSTAQSTLPACVRVGRAGRRRQSDDPSLRTTHQPPLQGQAPNRAGPAPHRPPGAALVLPDVIRQAVRPRRSAQRSDPA
jgi:hypothetical protein